MMTVIIFLIVLALLILVHEFGHFIVAKKSGIRVDEFSIGFPPRIFSYKPEGDETTYSVGIIPFGGYVKIHGENYEDIAETEESGEKDLDEERSFAHKGKHIQAAVLSAGVIFNWLFAFVLISIAFAVGVNANADDFPQYAKDPHVAVTGVLPQSPAHEAGLKAGDEILSVAAGETEISGEMLTVTAIQEFIATSAGEVTFLIERSSEEIELTALPQEGVIEEQKAVGISMARLGTVQLPVHKAVYQGLRQTLYLTEVITVGLVTFIYQAVTGAANIGQLTGPVGIAGLVGEATSLGFVTLMMFTAFISIHLALLNLIPFPALDGGRLLFVLIEKIKGSPISPKIAMVTNTVGFALLILLMIVVTYNDIARLI